MLEEETKKHFWLRIAAIALITFIAAFLAFYLVMEIMYHKMTKPMFKAQQLERMIDRQQKSFQSFENKLMEHPFEPKMRPMLVNLIKENNVYKVIVDLKPLDENEDNINVKINGDELTVTGELDKKSIGREKIIHFTQTYYLDEKLDTDNIQKERRGDKYIITIPIKD